MEGVLLAGVGCASLPRGFNSPDPGTRIKAAIRATAERDLSSIRYLIGMLESDDPLERMMAIRALETLTGETHGYDYAAPEWDRQAAVDRWVEWHESSASADGGGVGR